MAIFGLGCADGHADGSRADCLRFSPRTCGAASLLPRSWPTLRFVCGARDHLLASTSYCRFNVAGLGVSLFPVRPCYGQAWWSPARSIDPLQAGSLAANILLSVCAVRRLRNDLKSADVAPVQIYSRHAENQVRSFGRSRFVDYLDLWATGWIIDTFLLTTRRAHQSPVITVPPTEIWPGFQRTRIAASSK